MTTIRFVLTVEPDSGDRVITERYSELRALAVALESEWGLELDDLMLGELVDGYPLEGESAVFSVDVEVLS